jgi:hypothetical protein
LYNTANQQTAERLFRNQLRSYALAQVTGGNMFLVLSYYSLKYTESIFLHRDINKFYKSSNDHDLFMIPDNSKQDIQINHSYRNDGFDSDLSEADTRISLLSGREKRLYRDEFKNYKLPEKFMRFIESNSSNVGR